MSANTINNRNTNFLLLFKIHYSLQALNISPTNFTQGDYTISLPSAKKNEIRNFQKSLL